MNQYQRSLALLDEFIANHSEAEIATISKRVADLEFEGPTFREYLENFETAYLLNFRMNKDITLDYQIDSFENMEIDEEFGRNTLIVLPNPKQNFQSTKFEECYDLEPNCNRNLAA